MTKEEVIKRLESIKETYETFAHGLDDIHLDIEALDYAIENLNDKPVTNREKIIVQRAALWLNADFKERSNDIYAEKKNNCE